MDKLKMRLKSNSGLLDGHLFFLPTICDELSSLNAHIWLIAPRLINLSDKVRTKSALTCISDEKMMIFVCPEYDQNR